MTQVTLKGNAINLSGNLPETGSKAIDFSLIRRDLSEVSLENFKGKKKILSIVPSLDTGVCAASAKKFNERLSGNDNVVMINVSMDLPFAQDRFCKEEGVNNSEALSAFRSTFPEDYGVKITDGPLKGLCARAIVIIDEDNKVIYTQLVPEITQEPDYDQAITHLS